MTALVADEHVVQALDRFHALDREALDRIPPPDPLVAGLLPRQGLAMLAGSRGLGKSLLALSIAASVATGQPAWMGLRVARHGPVLYVSLEGFHGVPERVRAWEAGARARAEGVLWLPQPVDLKRPADAALLGIYARYHGAVLVVIDSARATGAGAEDTTDMGAYVRGLEAVRDHSRALVLVLHNTGWDGSRERGSTLLPDACDTTLLLEGDPAGVRLLRHRKHRDGQMLDDPLPFTFRPVDGTRSGVLEPCTPPVSLSLPDRVERAVAADPMKTTQHYARTLDAERSSVSKAMTGLENAGRVCNLGTRQRPAWAVPQPVLEQQ